MAQRRTNPYNVSHPVNEDIYDEVDLPDYNTEKKEFPTQSMQLTTMQESSTVQPKTPEKKFSKKKFSKKKLTSIFLLMISVFIILLIIIVLASVAISLLKSTQGKLAYMI